MPEMMGSKLMDPPVPVTRRVTVDWTGRQCTGWPSLVSLRTQAWLAGAGAPDGPAAV